jgi:hypothetical protein
MPAPVNPYFPTSTGRSNTPYPVDASQNNPSLSSYFQEGSIKQKTGRGGSNYGQPRLDKFGFPTGDIKSGGTSTNKQVQRLTEVGLSSLFNVRKGEENILSQAGDYAQYLTDQIGAGRLSPQEASSRFEDFGLAYKLPETFKIAGQIAGTTRGVTPTSTVESYRPFTQFAAQQLGLGQLSEGQLKGYEQAAQAIGKAATPEAFSEFLGTALMSSPEYIRSNPLAFMSNLPYGGKYGIPYRTAGGAMTGTFRFDRSAPASALNY